MQYHRRYASRTSVASDRSQAEIQKILRRYGATGCIIGWQDQNAAVGFEMKSRQVRFHLPMPDMRTYEKTSRGKPRAASVAAKAYEQATRQAWRALALSIKAKLETVEAGIAVFEQEFLAYLVIPGTGKTYGDMAIPAIDDVYAHKKMPPLIGMNGGHK